VTKNFGNTTKGKGLTWGGRGKYRQRGGARGESVKGPFVKGFARAPISGNSKGNKKIGWAKKKKKTNGEENSIAS